jgi:sigma-E factor negative regulatory protein RseA
MKENLSAFLDGELDQSNSSSLIESLRSAPRMRQSWESYCLIGDSIRGDHVGAPDFVSRVMAGIDSEPTMIAPAAAVAVRQKSFFGRSLMPVAASVMGVAMVGLVAFSIYPDAAPDPVVQAPSVVASQSNPTLTASAVPVATAPQVDATAAYSPHREYMFVHQAMSGGPIPGVVHYVRTVSDVRGEQR